MKFFFAANGVVYENDTNLPLAVVKPMVRDAKCVFRFAYDRKANKLYVQDASFRRKLAEGDEDSWECLNHALLSLAKDGVTYPERDFGDPPGSDILRKLSDYKAAWKEIGEFMRDELGMRPDDMQVCEHPGDAKEDDIEFSAKGGKCGDDDVKTPLLYVARTRFTDQEGDIDYSKINDKIAEFYLENIEEMNSSDEATKHWIGKRLAVHKDKHGHDPMFAVNINGKTRIFRGRKPDGSLLDEFGIRSSESMSPYGGILTTFSVDGKKKKVVLHNHMPSEMAKSPYSKQVLEDIVEAAARMCGCPRRELVVAFAPGLSSAFVSSLSRYRVAWDFLARSETPENVKVVEAPVDLGYSLAKGIRGKDDEPEALAKYRVLNGIDVQGPFIAIDNRGHRRGSVLRDLVKAYAGLMGANISSPNQIEAMELMRHMANLDFSDSEIVDFFCDRYDTKTRRVAKKLLRAAMIIATASRSGMKKLAQNTGLGIGINDWWQLGLQEQLNRTQHTNTNPKKVPDPASDANSPKPFNLRKFRERQKHSHYETMLREQHDKDMSSQKTMEQLLRESRK